MHAFICSKNGEAGSPLKGYPHQRRSALQVQWFQGAISGSTSSADVA